MFAQLRSCGWWESRQLPPVLEEKNLLSIFSIPFLFLFNSPHRFYFLNFFCFLIYTLFVCTKGNLWLMGIVWDKNKSLPTLAVLFSSLFIFQKIPLELFQFFKNYFVLFYPQTIIVLAGCLFAQLRSFGWWESRQLLPVLQEKNTGTSLNFFLSLVFFHISQKICQIFSTFEISSCFF